MASRTAIEIEVSSATAKPLAERFAEVRRTTEHLCANLSSEDCMVQSMPEASPAKWHLAHTTWFYETFILTPHLPNYKPLNPDFRYLFNSYYNAVGDRPLRQARGGLGFENESPRQQVYIQEFSLGSRLITSREYLEFMEGGGYNRPELWLSDGWDVARLNSWQAPLYWERENAKTEWQVYTSI